ncbi:MAG TPA: hypothetical protein VF665_07565, partial [Longimicrobium sp.]
MRFRSLLLAAPAVLALNACAAPMANSGPSASPGGARGSGSAAIRTDDLRRDLFFLASDSMRGRRGATDDEIRASMWLAAQAQAMGLQPAGDDGTFFQFFPIRRLRMSETSTVTLGGRALRLWEDAVVIAPVDARIDAAVMAGEGSPPAAGAAAGRAIVARLQPPATQTPRWLSLWSWRQTSGAVAAQRTALLPSNPSAIVFVADSVGVLAFENLIKSAREGRYMLDTLGLNPRAGIPPVPVLLVRPEAVAGIDLATARFTADLRTENFVYPSVNVVA